MSAISFHVIGVPFHRDLFATLIDQVFQAFDFGRVQIGLIGQVQHQRQWVASKQSFHKISHGSFHDLVAA